jgi:hypothetical protein
VTHTESFAEWDVSDDEASQVERSNGGMPRWSFLGIRLDDGQPKIDWPYFSNVNGERFLTRFIVFFTPWGGCHITRISMADDQRKWPHDHSRTFLSWVMGWYAEEIYDAPDDLSSKRHVRHRRFGIHRLRWTEAHSITAVSPRLWTILFLGRQRNMSTYWTPEGKSPLGMKAN